MASQQDDCGYDPAMPPLEALRIITELPSRVEGLITTAGDAASEIVGFMAHEAIHHLLDMQRVIEKAGTANA